MCQTIFDDAREDRFGVPRGSVQDTCKIRLSVAHKEQDPQFSEAMMRFPQYISVSLHLILHSTVV